MAAKFKVGDRVRFTEDNPDGGSNYGAKGAVAKIVRIRDEVGFSGSDVDIEPIGWNCVIKPGASSRVLELCPEYKVGDRVRSLVGVQAGKVGAIINDDGIEPRYLVRFDDWRGGHGADKNEWWQWSKDVEPAPLTIVAGRFYKTRAGRKVGPMRPFDSLDGQHPWVGDLDRAYEGNKFLFLFKRTGENYEYRDLDIIAEWHIETAKRGNQAATVDAIADEYGGAKSGGPKFKVGDRVKCIKNSDGRGFGLCGTVADVGGWGVGVEMDEPFRGHGDSGRRWNFFYSDVQLILINTPSTTPSTTAIVALIENGQPKPADRPFVHPDRAAASREAGRLAGKHKGKEFGVYEFVSSVSVTPEHEWQRLAAKGKTWAAARALSEAAGLPYDMAKSSVEYWLMRAA